jgi:hypothetical protein
MKSYTRILNVVFSFSLLVSLTSCYKLVLENMTRTGEVSTTQKMATDTSEVRKLMVAQAWQIEEVVDSFSGVRYQRGKISDGKEFQLTRYTYGENGSITGLDWFGNPIKNTSYSLQEGDRKFVIVAPDCTSVNEVLFISATKFTYKANDGSVFTLTPVQAENAL